MKRKPDDARFRNLYANRGAIWCRAIALSTLFAAGCASIEPPSTVVYTALTEPGRSAVLVSTGEYRTEVEEALRSAGVRVADSLATATLVMRVKVGDARMLRRGRCGLTRNVVYDLREGAARIAVIKARGIVGVGCSPNVFDEMSREVARLVSAGEGESK